MDYAVRYGISGWYPPRSALKRVFAIDLASSTSYGSSSLALQSLVDNVAAAFRAADFGTQPNIDLALVEAGLLAPTAIAPAAPEAGDPEQVLQSSASSNTVVVTGSVQPPPPCPRPLRTS